MLTIGEYEIDKKALISRNSESDILYAHSKQNRYAAKVVLKGLGQDAVEKFRHESAMLKEASCPYVCRFVNYLETQKYALLVMELMASSLKSLEVRSELQVDGVRTIFREVLLALHELHGMGISHRNIEPSNVMFSLNRKLKLIDFENAVHFDSVIDPSQIRIKQVTGYEAPEILARMNHDEKADIWSAGVLFHWMLFGEIPFQLPDSCTTKELLTAISVVCVGGFKINQRLFSKHSRNISRTIESFLKQMLHLDPVKRASTEQLLCHPIFQQKFKMKLFTYDRGTARKLDSKLSQEGSTEPSSPRHSPKLESLLTSELHHLDHQKYMLYKFPMSCFQYFRVFDNDIHRKQVKTLRCYLLCISVMYCFSMLEAIKKERLDPADPYLQTIEDDYYSLKSQFQLEMYSFECQYPYDSDNDISTATTFECIKYKYRALCQQLAKSCLENYNDSRSKMEQRIVHLRLALRLTALAVMNRIFTHQKFKKLGVMEDYRAVSGERGSVESFNQFLERAGFQKSSQYVKEIMKMFD